MEQIGSSLLPKNKLRIRINLATPLKIGLFHGSNTNCVSEGGKEFLSQNKVEDFFGDEEFFCVTFWLYSAPNKREDHFLRIFSKILQGGWWGGKGRLIAFLFYYNIENLFWQDIVLFVIDFFVIFSSKQK